MMTTVLPMPLLRPSRVFRSSDTTPGGIIPASGRFPGEHRTRSSRIHGVYPGGPTSPVRGKSGARWDARTADEMWQRGEERRHRAHERSVRWRRTRALVVTLLTAGLGGWLLGSAGTTDGAALAAEREASAVERSMLSDEVDRVLIELWKMETLEAAPMR